MMHDDTEWRHCKSSQHGQDKMKQVAPQEPEARKPQKARQTREDAKQQLIWPKSKKSNSQRSNVALKK